MMKKSLIVSIIVLSPILLAAQPSDSTRNPLAYLKLDFLNVINPIDPSVLFSVEYFPGKRWFSLGHEVGFVSEIRSYADVPIVNSFKTRHEVRFYIDLDESLRFFSGLNFQYRSLTVHETYVVGYDCGGDCGYYRKVDNNFHTKRFAYFMEWGIQSTIANRLLLEASGSLGTYNFQINRSDFYEGNLIERNRFIEKDKVGNQVYLSVNGRIGYILFKPNRKVD